MNTPNQNERFRQLKSSQLSRLLRVEADVPEPWGEQDLEAMFKHQLGAPLDFDLSSLPPTEATAADVAAALRRETDGRVATFGALLAHPQPPPDLLRLAKNFFKHRAAQFSKGSPDWQLAYCFYLLTILVGLDHTIPLSALSPAELLQAMEWAGQQSWLDETTRAMIARAQARLVGPGQGN